MTNDILNALASEHFVCLRNYGARWGIAHKSFDGVSIAEIFDKHLDRLLEQWVTLEADITIHKDEQRQPRDVVAVSHKCNACGDKNIDNGATEASPYCRRCVASGRAQSIASYGGK